MLKFCNVVVPDRPLHYFWTSRFKDCNCSNWLFFLFAYLCKGTTDVDHYVIVYNPLAWNITTIVTVPVNISSMSVYDELGHFVPAQVLQSFFLLIFFHLPVLTELILHGNIVHRGPRITSSWDLPSSPLSDLFVCLFSLPVLSIRIFFGFNVPKPFDSCVFGLSFACLLCATWQDFIWLLCCVLKIKN